MPEYQTIQVDKKTKSTIDRLAKKHELTLIKFVRYMAEYFDLTGINPKDQKVLSPAEELKKFRDTIISFMRKQEKDFILPVFGQMETLIARFMQYLEHEAPKVEGQKPFEIPSSFKEKEEEKKEEVKPQFEEKNSQNLTIQSLELDLLQKKENLKFLKNEAMKIFEKYEFKSTGLNKKIVIEMSQGEFETIEKVIRNIAL